jgi:hypothetical protein
MSYIKKKLKWFLDIKSMLILQHQDSEESNSR